MVRIILAIVVIVLSGYSLIAQTLELMPYYMFSLGAFMLVTGFVEIQKERKGFWGYMNIVISLFLFFFLHTVFLIELTGALAENRSCLKAAFSYGTIRTGLLKKEFNLCLYK
ncbi:DUF3953 domain-containing protein [Peribacillus frigoritolerans]|uniref:DUF3953 domain-containing protein n=1 Tax=Peribacillus frigoritolerans TaxID=450367 RepID=UPI002B05AF82|nr:DUF3953 domain-containing protein [Peribacillus frigoritolerans]MCP1097066.1 DUF3953 domain-containing protein [Bacillaceae bacterium OS4b]MEA3577591.1 DUF3953 domain-containing protein [Peribacillus frigoritolerans]